MPLLLRALCRSDVPCLTPALILPEGNPPRPSTLGRSNALLLTRIEHGTVVLSCTAIIHAPVASILVPALLLRPPWTYLLGQFPTNCVILLFSLLGTLDWDPPSTGCPAVLLPLPVWQPFSQPLSPPVAFFRPT